MVYLRVCYFGTYNRDNRAIGRDLILIKGMRKNNIVVVECWTKGRRFLTPFAYFQLISKYIRIGDYDAMILGFPGFYISPLARLLTKISGRPLIFNLFISTYEAQVLDRGLAEKSSIKSSYYHLLDEYSCKLSDIVLLDTLSHILFVCGEYGLEKEKFRRIFVGADDDLFFPKKVKKNGESFIVTFFGTYIPLHGVEHIIQAAKLLERHKDIKFELIGKGQTYEKMVNLKTKLGLENITFDTSMGTEKIIPLITKADVCLGIFGDSDKAKLVIPNKVFQIIAMKKPLITGDSPAIKEAGFKDRENCILGEFSNPQSIADSILLLKEDEGLRQKIAENGYRLFKERFSPEKIGLELKKVIAELT